MKFMNEQSKPGEDKFLFRITAALNDKGYPLRPDDELYFPDLYAAEQFVLSNAARYANYSLNRSDCALIRDQATGILLSEVNFNSLGIKRHSCFNCPQDRPKYIK
jgi:hypothetical protein